MDSHIGPRCIAAGSGDIRPWAASTRFYWSRSPERKVAIFIHGFTGHALTTWEQFVTLWPEDKPGWDLVFYGYDSLYTQVGTNAASFAEFLEVLTSDPAEFINSTNSHLFTYDKTLRRDDDFSYSKIVMVAHSLGAIVSRQALLLEKDKPWVSHTRLVLFGPAHKGAFPLGLALEALTSIPFAAAAGATIRFVVTSLDGLEKDGPTVRKLESNTIVAAKEMGKPFTASRVIFAEKERVVVNEPFGLDPRPEVFYGEGHRSVCKPRKGWDDPLTVVKEVLDED